MSEWLTANKMSKRSSPLNIGDFSYVCEITSDQGRQYEFSLSLAAIFKKARFKKFVPPEFHEVLTETPEFFYTFLEVEYSNYLEKNHGREPSWVRAIPDVVLGQLRRIKLIQGWKKDAMLVCYYPKFLGINFVVKEYGLTENLMRSTNFSRLSRIRQLGFLHSPLEIFSDSLESTQDKFNHTRFDHSLLTAAIALLIAYNNQLTQYQRTHLKFAALTHDIMTPAGGDSTKLIAPKELDEDENYSIFLQTDGCNFLCKRYKLCKDKLKQIILGQGVLGKILNFSDKIAYVSRDAWTIAYDSLHFSSNKSHADLKKFLPSLAIGCTFWDSIRIINNQVVITDPDRYFKFLQLRTYLFKNFYFNPFARFREYVLFDLFAKRLYYDGVFDKQKLLEWDDFDLQRMIEEKIGTYWSQLFIGWNSEIKVESFKTLEEAKCAEKEFINAGFFLTTIEKLPRPKASLYHLVLNEGQILPFEQARPELASIIQEELNIKDLFVIYAIRDCSSNFTDQVIKLVRDHQKSK